LARVFEQARAAGKTIAMTNGCFDIIHPGHVQYLCEARKTGDMLAVAVNADDSVQRLKGDTRPIQPLASRMAVLAGLECVDYVVAFSEDTPEELYCALLPDVLVKGGDYHADEVAGGACVREQGGRVEIVSFVDNQSSSNIINRIKETM
jgi:D-beta-D-heptose 7-phosphate kinase / D-beta-D-heptose 1-phosphate adenosyltransferase